MFIYGRYCLFMLLPMPYGWNEHSRQPLFWIAICEPTKFIGFLSLQTTAWLVTTKEIMIRIISIKAKTKES